MKKKKDVEREYEWGFIFNVSNIEEIDYLAFHIGEIKETDNHWTILLSADNEEDAIDQFINHLHDVYNIMPRFVEITNVALQQ